MTPPTGYVAHKHGQSPSVGTEAFYCYVSACVRFELAAKPWTLIALADGELLIAERRSLWMRCVTWWLNRERRREKARLDALEVARLADWNQRVLEGTPLKDGSTE
jgi:hypothetical protein